MLLMSALVLIYRGTAHSTELWPDISVPPKYIGGGGKDAAIVVGIENYLMVAKIPGARKTSEDWQSYLTVTLGIPMDRVSLLRDNEATVEKIRRFTTQAVSQVKEGGTLWFIFIGHGAPSKNGKDGLLVGADAQQDPDSLYARSFSREELLGILSKGRQAKSVVLIDACFSGRTPSGDSLAEGLQPLIALSASTHALSANVVMLTAAKADQFAGPLPKSTRRLPAFSYLALGALRGWGADDKGKVTAESIIAFARKALSLEKGRSQTPELLTSIPNATLGHGIEKAPDLAQIDREDKTGSIAFEVSPLPVPPALKSPNDLAYIPKTTAIRAAPKVSGMDFSPASVEELEKYDEAIKFEQGSAASIDKWLRWTTLGIEVSTYAKIAEARALVWGAIAEQDAYNDTIKFDKSRSSPEEKAARWRKLGSDFPKYGEIAEARAVDWERYASEMKMAEEAASQQSRLQNEDWDKLSRLLAISVVSSADKVKFSQKFIEAYSKSPGIEPDMARAMAAFFPESPIKSRLLRIAQSKPHVLVGRAGVQWIWIHGGVFDIGAAGPESVKFLQEHEGDPSVKVRIKSFRIAKTKVTNKQYTACVNAGACTAPNSYGKELGFDDQPVMGIDWYQAKAFSEWVGGRLPSESEWEYAARSAGKKQDFPWGNTYVTCSRAIVCGGGDGCGRYATWPVCSKPSGNTDQGLCDMVGNGKEWVADGMHRLSETPLDGTAGDGSNHATRGASWKGCSRPPWVAWRDADDTSGQSEEVSFRPAQ